MVGALGVRFFARPAREVAADLVGCLLTGRGVAGIIVEVERYERWDAASHSFRGPRPRCRAMFGPPGRLYVYRSYGRHWCANIVCGGGGAAVLLRAVEPTDGRDLMRLRRARVADRDLCRGPGRLAAAFAIDGADDGGELGPASDLHVLPRSGGAVAVRRGPRIGISRDAGRAWRYTLEGSAWLSGGPRAAAAAERLQLVA